jgi:hypothetical protein
VKRSRALLIVTFAMCVLAVATWRLLVSWNRLAVFSAGSGEDVELRMDSFCDPNCAIHYRVLKNGTRLVSDSAIGYTPVRETITFQNIAPSGNGLVAIVEASAPDVLLALHDFRTGRTWPAGSDGRNADATGTALLEHLRTLRPGNYILGTHVPGNRPAKVQP